MANDTKTADGKPGTWPNGEPQSVPDAYDATNGATGRK